MPPAIAWFAGEALPVRSARHAHRLATRGSAVAGLFHPMRVPVRPAPAARAGGLGGQVERAARFRHCVPLAEEAGSTPGPADGASCVAPQLGVRDVAAPPDPSSHGRPRHNERPSGGQLVAWCQWRGTTSTGTGLWRTMVVATLPNRSRIAGGRTRLLTAFLPAPASPQHAEAERDQGTNERRCQREQPYGQGGVLHEEAEP